MECSFGKNPHLRVKAGMNVYYLKLLKMLQSSLSSNESKPFYQREDGNLPSGKKRSINSCVQREISVLSPSFIKSVLEKATSECPGDERVWNLYEIISTRMDSSLVHLAAGNNNRKRKKTEFY
jgi:hypothetical protein